MTAGVKESIGRKGRILGEMTRSITHFTGQPLTPTLSPEYRGEEPIVANAHFTSLDLTSTASCRGYLPALFSTQKSTENWS